MGVTGVDVSRAALLQARANMDETGWGGAATLVQCDIGGVALCLEREAAEAAAGDETGDAEETRERGILFQRGSFDTVVLNPPFGTRAKGADMRFVRVALAMVRQGGAVYSLHKSSTRKHVLKAAQRMGAVEAEALVQFRYPLKATCVPALRGRRRHGLTRASCRFPSTSPGFAFSLRLLPVFHSHAYSIKCTRRRASTSRWI